MDTYFLPSCRASSEAHWSLRKTSTGHDFSLVFQRTWDLPWPRGRSAQNCHLWKERCASVFHIAAGKQSHCTQRCLFSDSEPCLYLLRSWLWR